MPVLTLGIVASSYQQEEPTPPDFEEIWYSDFSTAPMGDNAFLPATGWVANDWDDGGHTNDSTWHTYRDTSPFSVLYSTASTHLHYDTTSDGHEVEALFKMNGSSGDCVGGVMAAGDATTDVLNYIGFELVYSSTENKIVVYYRDGVTHDEYFEQLSAGLVRERWYKMRLRYAQGTVSAWLDEGLVVSSTLPPDQIAALAGHTRCGVINYTAANNWDNISIRKLLVAPPADTSLWKGAGSVSRANLPAELGLVDVSWYYDWASYSVPGVGDVPSTPGVEYVPMMWGDWDRDYAGFDVGGTPAESIGPATTLLGFNEPNEPNQSDMTVARCRELWPLMEATGARLGSPAMATAGGWESFMAAFMADSAGYKPRVDFLCVHWYVDYNGGFTDFGAYLDYWHSLFPEYPVWVTEVGNLQGGQAANAALMDSIFAECLERPWVERIAWYALQPTGWVNTELVTPGSPPTLTVSGTEYATFDAKIPREPTPPQTTYTMFGESLPTALSVSDSNPVQLGTMFYVTEAGTITKLRCPRRDAATQLYKGYLYNGTTAALLGEVTFPTGAFQWVEAALPTPVSVVPGQVYCVSYWKDSTQDADAYYTAPHYFDNIVNVGKFSLPPGSAMANGRYRYQGVGSADMPVETFNNTCYFADVVFEPGAPLPPLPDTFDYATLSDEDYTVVWGTLSQFEIVTGGVRAVGNYEPDWLMWNDEMASADYEVTTVITHTDLIGGATGPIARATSLTDKNSYVAWVLGDSWGGVSGGVGVRLYRCDAESEIALSGPVMLSATGATFKVTLRCVGSEISVYVDDELVIGPVTDATYSAPGYAGMRVYTNSFNQRIESFDAQPYTETVPAPALHYDFSDAARRTMSGAFCTAITGRVGSTLNDGGYGAYEIVTTSPTGRECVLFEGGAGYTGDLDTDFTSSYFTLCVAYRFQSGVTWARVMSLANPGSDWQDSGSIMVGRDNDRMPSVNKGNGGGSQSALFPSVTYEDQWMVLTVTINNGPTVIRINGTVVATGTLDMGGGVLASRLGLGAQAQGGANGDAFRGELGELKIWDSVLSAGAVESEESLLANRWIAYSDNFNRADGNLEDMVTWQRANGHVKIQSNHLYIDSTGCADAYIGADFPPTSHWAEGVMTIQNGQEGSLGPSVRQGGGENAYYSWLRGTVSPPTFEIWRQWSGAYQQIGNYAIPVPAAATGPVRVAVEVDGLVIRGYVEGEMVIEWTEDNPGNAPTGDRPGVNGGMFGATNGQVQMDDYRCGPGRYPGPP